MTTASSSPTFHNGGQRTRRTSVSSMTVAPTVRSPSCNMIVAVMVAMIIACMIPSWDTDTTSEVPSITRTLSSNTIPASVSSNAAAENDRYIVSFHEYRDREEHSRTLTTLLHDSSSIATDSISSSTAAADAWHIVDRQNAASSLPTDFLLVSLSEPSTSATSTRLLSTLRAATHHIRYVELDRPMKLTPQTSSDDTHDDDDYHDITARFTIPRGGTSALSSDDVDPAVNDANITINGRRLHGFFGDDSVTSVQGADWVWKQGYTGRGVRVAIFDTGLAATHPHFKNIRERTNWTGDKTLDDTQGHGTSVAGIIASHADCQGFAPDADLHIFRVFDSKVTSYTAWFLDAFNYAIHTRVHILNLSIGGPDWADKPFVDKVHELAANGVVVISAIGNVETGKPPLWGSLNNPADQLDVLGVGGIDFNSQLARFSARGMTTWELPDGYGRIKPDIVAHGANVRASGRNGGCKTQSGTSFASPVAAGVATLLSSIVPNDANGVRSRKLNPASMKQVITESAVRVAGERNNNKGSGGNGVGIYEQGMGRLNLRGAYDLLSSYTPRASVLPSILDFTDCPYMWPFCTQPLYHTSQPYVMNMTILNGMSVSGYLRHPPVWYPDNKASEDAIAIDFTYPKALWPWSGYLGVFISVATPVDVPFTASGFVSLTVTSDDDAQTQSTVNFTVRIACQPAPPRHKRLLWDQFHNLNYPSGYFPRDDIHVLSDVLDWNGDHPHTNFRDLYIWLRDHDYYVEILRHDYTCFDARHYGALMIVDSEEEFFTDEVHKLAEDIGRHGMSLLILGEWYNVATFPELKFHDQNTKRWWLPVTGGANIPALNDLLAPYGAAFGDRAWYGSVEVGGQSIHYASGTSIARWPRGGYLLEAQLTEPHPDQGRATQQKHLVPFMGAIPGANVADAIRAVGNYSWITNDMKSGRIVVYGDSNCWDMKDRSGQPCYRVMEKMLEFALGGDNGDGHIDDGVWTSDRRVVSSYKSDMMKPPHRPNPNHEFRKHSRVLAPGAHPQCIGRAPGVNDNLSSSMNDTIRRGRVPRASVTQHPSIDDNDNSNDMNKNSKPIRPSPSPRSYYPIRHGDESPPRLLWWLVIISCMVLFGLVFRRLGSGIRNGSSLPLSSRRPLSRSGSGRAIAI